MKYDVVVIGAGISGLTTAALLSKRNLKVCVVDAQFKPGGSCGIFKRKDVIFEQGCAMLYGFNDRGYSPHRYVFNELEEEIDIIKHDKLYAINYDGHRIIFHQDIDMFIDELVKVFPNEKSNFKRFYTDLSNQYRKVIAENPAFISPDAMKKEYGLKSFLKHPIEYIRFLGYMNKNTESILKKYFKDPEVFKFFDKLTSTYCYTNVVETPAILSSIMFVDNHFGGSYYPAGSTLNFIGKLEKVIEENDGEMIYNKEVEKIIVESNKATGVQLDDGSIINGKYIVNSGNVWNLYNKLLKDNSDEKIVKWVNSLIPSYPSVVLFALVKDSVIPKDTLPIEMLVGSKDKFDENEITVYIPSIDDKTICPDGYQSIMAIGPTLKKWPIGFKNKYNTEEYRKAKEIEKNRLLDVFENRFPGFKENLFHVEISTPSTLNRYALKEGGAAAGPKQQLGQHMMKRLKTKSEIDRLFNCGESTVMGTGTTAVTVSGISAANLILRELGIEEYEYRENMKNYVNIVKPPFKDEDLKISNNAEYDKLAKLALKCQFCEVAICQKGCKYNVPIRDINRRVAVGNIYGDRKLLNIYKENPCKNCENKDCENHCVRKSFDKSVSIKEINSKL
ncbi:MAG: FAD-dependent oxidoreductase [Romboutsia sp.]|nr:FAD-dependent oxidoreductase [Romboutsia sp.]